MRESTCSSYVLLIVDRRNITGRHQTGNAWGYVSECQSLTGISLLEPIEAMFMALGPVPSDEFPQPIVVLSVAYRRIQVMLVRRFLR